MNLVASYSMLNTWDICAHQAARRYIIKDLPKEKETVEMAYGNVVHKAFENRLKTGHWGQVSETHQHEFEPFVRPLDGRNVKPELMLGINDQGVPVGFWDGSVYLRGKLDAPVIDGTTALLLDWKTGKPREEPLELEIGALLLQAKHPEITQIKGRYVWLKDLRLGQEHDCSDTARTWKIVNDKMDEIGHAAAMGTFKKTPGPLCAWCPVTDCQHNKRAA